MENAQRNVLRPQKEETLPYVTTGANLQVMVLGAKGQSHEDTYYIILSIGRFKSSRSYRSREKTAARGWGRGKRSWCFLGRRFRFCKMNPF